MAYIKTSNIQVSFKLPEISSKNGKTLMPIGRGMHLAQGSRDKVNAL